MGGKLPLRDKAYWCETSVITLDELKAELRAILAEEGRATVDWPQVEAHCLRLSLRLPKSSLSDFDFPHEIFHYLADAGIRRKDEDYATEQRAELRNLLSEGSPAS
jgi:hypothetical protein